MNIFFCKTLCKWLLDSHLRGNDTTVIRTPKATVMRTPKATVIPAKAGIQFSLSHSKQFLFILALFLSPEVFAAGGLFEVLPTDKSMEYLGIIFGGSVGAITLSGDANPMLSRMFERFNFIIVTIGVVILSYIAVVAAINTAREGESMGKKFSLWVPLRAMLGMLLMVPSPGTGYSVVQMTVMWVVLNGIGAANTIWGVVLDQLGSGLKASGKVELPINDADLGPTVEAVLKALTCMKVVNSIPNSVTDKYGPVKITTNYLPFKPPTVSPPKPGMMGKLTSALGTKIEETAIVSVGIEGSTEPADKSICGEFTVSTEILAGDPNNSFNKSSLDTRLNIKVNALMAMFSVLEPAAESLAVVPLPVGEPSEGYVRQAINGYKAQLVNLAMGINNAAGSRPSTDVSTVMGGAIDTGISATGKAFVDVGYDIKEAWENTNDKVAVASEQVAAFKRLGWIHAGSYYYAMSKSQPTKLDGDALSKPTPKIPSPISPSVIDTTDLAANLPPVGWTNGNKVYSELATVDNRKRFINAIANAKKFFDNDMVVPAKALPALGSGKVSSGNGFIDEILSGISDKIRTPIIEMFQSAFTGQKEDPLISIGKFGWEIMMSGELGIFISMILAFGFSMAASPGACMNPAAFAANQLLLQVFIVVFTFLLLMWSLGATMGVYMPLIPYIIFTGTAVGWLLAVIEAIVAAPLIALAMVQPGGEELGGIKEPIMILTNLFIRPSLMIFGFVIAGSFLRAILTMVNFGFARAVEESVITTLFAIFPILGIYVGFVIAVINQAFGLIYELPNKVMRYMGHSESGYNPAGMIQGAKSGADSGSKAATGAIEAGGKALQGKLKGKLAEAKKLQDEKTKADKEKAKADKDKAGKGSLPGEAGKSDAAKSDAAAKLSAALLGGADGSGGGSASGSGSVAGADASADSSGAPAAGAPADSSVPPPPAGDHPDDIPPPPAEDHPDDIPPPPPADDTIQAGGASIGGGFVESADSGDTAEENTFWNPASSDEAVRYGAASDASWQRAPAAEPPPAVNLPEEVQPLELQSQDDEEPPPPLPDDIPPPPADDEDEPLPPPPSEG